MRAMIASVGMSRTSEATMMIYRLKASHDLYNIYARFESREEKKREM